MKLLPTSLPGFLAAALTSGKTLSIIFGTAFLIDCRHNPKEFGGLLACWSIGGTAIGIPGVISMKGKLEYERGFGTLNPALRRKEEEPKQDDNA
jgi:hypothetical protein